MRKSLIAAFIVFFGTAFMAMPVASANPLVDFWNKITDNDPPAENPPVEEPGEEPGEPGEEPGEEPPPEDSADDEEPVEEPELPEGPTEEGSQAKSGKSSTQPQSASSNTSGNGGQLPKTATPYPLMLLVSSLIMAVGLVLLKVRPSRN